MLCWVCRMGGLHLHHHLLLRFFFRFRWCVRVCAVQVSARYRLRQRAVGGDVRSWWGITAVTIEVDLYLCALGEKREGVRAAESAIPCVM